MTLDADVLAARLEHLRQVVEERDRLYLERDAARREAIQKALDAQHELVAGASEVRGETRANAAMLLAVLAILLSVVQWVVR